MYSFRVYIRQEMAEREFLFLMGYILSSQNLKIVPVSPPVTNRKGSKFENRVLIWVPSLTPSDPRAIIPTMTVMCNLIQHVLTGY
jgi:hypothetical protein